MEFSTDREVILWKSITNGILIAQINIRLCCIDFHKGVNKGGVICGLNVYKWSLICGIKVLLCSDFSEQFITLSPRSQYPSNIT